MTTNWHLRSLLLTLALTPLAQAGEQHDYDWLTMGEKTGGLRIERQDDGSAHAHFELSDRGRGPKIDDRYRLDAKGMLLSQEISGHSYMGASIAESFQLAQGHAQWHSMIEQGEKADAAGAYYLANDGSLASLAALVKYALAQPDRSIDLLPLGRLQAERVATEKVRHAGEEKSLGLYAVTGLGFSPSYIWLDEQQNLFGMAAGWVGLTPAGWGKVLPALQKRQDEVEIRYWQELAGKHQHGWSGELLLKNARVFDAEQGRMLDHQDVLLRAGQIAAVGRDLAAPKNAKILDASGKTLLPGLWDMHGHLQESDGLLNIAAGVTNARDMGNEHERVSRLRQDFNSGKLIGPRLTLAGFIDKKSPYSAPTGKLVDSLDQAIAAVNWYADRGYPQIKIYSSIEPSWVAPIAKAVHRRGMRLSGHIPSFMSTEQAVKDGYDEIQHINMLLLNFLAKPTDDTRTPVRVTAVGERAGALDLQSKPVEDFIRLLKERQIVVDPTAGIFVSMYTQKPGKLNSNFAAIADHLPPTVRRSLYSGDMDINAKNEKPYQAAADTVLRLVKKLHYAGITLVPGTDNVAGFSLHRELELYSQAGIPNAQVLQLATLGSARVAKADKTLGSIAVGKQADLLLIDGNPLENISDIRKLSLVIKGDRYYRPDELNRALGVEPFAKSVGL